ncbi:aminotransferase class I/II-fold pyridoxal phosphate-dependent enzyme [Archangium violaceum]|uniref:trans-sulfuration enzyme family protein n=1 Tax=Archangium violaceum TaxID=83451 RepID=UPI00193C6A5D|nr:aminotransferase class I/II-fold pyridoxal phosphate-dependent enzyme [Archangium violaceum]QRK10906.1 aminotransferase class I/II-fold pyridoxal phosphate-dependent enzyme [Archangium violaceum]
MADHIQDKHHLRTAAVHGGEPRKAIEGSISMPLFPSSTYVLGNPAEFDDIRYVRLNNTPNQQAVSEKLALLEGTEAAVVTPSGTAAVSMALLAHLEKGEHVLAQDHLYGGSRKLLDSLRERYGVEVTYVPAEEPEAWARALRPTTRVFYLETLTNPLLEVAPLDEAVAFARRHGLVSMIDNTFATPVNFRPVELGFDVVVHSASKYLNGHSDVVAGVVAASAERVKRVRKLMNLLGVCLDPHACFLLQRGLKTLPLRVPVQNENALALALAFKRHPGVREVRYPGLPEDPSHARARRWFKGYGATVCFAPVGGVERAERMLKRLRIPREAPSLGGLETLVCRPATTTHAGIPDDVRRGLGVADELIRVSLGVEDVEDIIQDFSRALGD